ncbi:hypothetical protein QTI33_19535 [Variovorax sp. J22P271]|uniref:hypothetical protein n=1 Tax=Variovorax davisae TaxID=3053515 RepID=UPI002578AF86|nr:hypothetical protein [Variovorax sp. J22P271]MDM0034337.1 hypothetical protein [Variovorax sp. J22P271]
MSIHRMLVKALWISAAADPAGVLAQESAVEATGNVRVFGELDQLAGRGPLHGAQALSNAIALPASATAQLDATLGARYEEISGSVTLRSARASNHAYFGSDTTRLILDELVYTARPGPFQLVVGKKVVSWDVGYAFRPNDLVQQEARRPLVQRTLEGRPLVMAEGFGEDSAWSIVAFKKKVRPEDAAPLAREEEAVAGRLYRRLGSADLYAFAGSGSASHGTAGASVSWVASDAIEFHASYRHAGRYSVRSEGPPSSVPARANPYVVVARSAADQGLIGMTWTTESKLGVIAEAWYDGTAPSDGFWQAWSERNESLVRASVSASPVVRQLVAGNLGWQAVQLGNGSLRRANVFLRVSWTSDPWEPALDLLYTPADRGLIATAGLSWKSDKLCVDAGLRYFGGAQNSLYAQTPIKAIAFLGLTLFF